MTEESRERISIIAEILGIGDIAGMMDLTDEGKKALKAKMAEITAIYKNMEKQYSQDGEDFYEAAPSYERELPMLVAMGFSGLAMGQMLALSDARYAALDHTHAQAQWVDHYPDAGGFGDFIGAL